MICQLPIIFFFCPFSILQYKSLSYREVCAIRAIRALKALRADRAPRGFQLHEEVPFPWSSQIRGPTHKALRALLPLTQHFLMWGTASGLHKVIQGECQLEGTPGDIEVAAAE